LGTPPIPAKMPCSIPTPSVRGFSGPTTAKI
jgi:hypothetical protein